MGRKFQTHFRPPHSEVKDESLPAAAVYEKEPSDSQAAREFDYLGSS